MAGYRLDTYVDGVLPFHPIYRESAFDLLSEGFPLLKRQFLHENPFDVPDLAQWKERVLTLTPGADVDAIEANLWRVSPPYNLRRALGIHTPADGSVAMPEPVLADNFDEYERWAPRFDHWWAFVVDPATPSSRGQRARRVRGGALRPRDQEGADRGAAAPHASAAPTSSVVPTATQAVHLVPVPVADDLRDPGSACRHPPPGVRGVPPVRRTAPWHPVAVVRRHHPGRAGRRPDGSQRGGARRRPDASRRRLVSGSTHGHAARAALPVAAQHLGDGLPADRPAGVPGGVPGRATCAPSCSCCAAPPGAAGSSSGRRSIGCDGRSLPALEADDLEWLRSWGERHDAVVGVRPGGGWPMPGPRGDQGRGPARAHAPLFSRHRDAAARGRRPGDRLLQRAARLRRALPARPGLSSPTWTRWPRIPGSSTTSPTWSRGRSVATRAELFGAWENLLAEPTAEQVAERARVRDLLHSYRDGRCGLRVARRVQATYLPKAWFPPNL